MKKIGILLILSGILILVGESFLSPASDSPLPAGKASAAQFGTPQNSIPSPSAYKYPDYYKGLYLTVNSAMDMERLKYFIGRAKAAGLNTLVMDVQLGKRVACMVPAANVKYCIDNGIHPVARIVVFPDGLRHYPVSDQYIEERLAIAEDACVNGFREIQFDYIRFHDSGSTKHLTYAQKYQFISQFISAARERTKRFKPRIAADIFGRVPLNKNDIIGQNMESLDRVLDIICPMAYPSHYTWSKKYYADPYFAVYETSVRAKQRARKAIIVTWIQAFKMRLSGIPYDRYVLDQLRAVRDSGVNGYFLWNARQDYDLPLAVVENFSRGQISQQEGRRDRSAVD